MAKISQARKALKDAKPKSRVESDAAGEYVNPGFDADSIREAFAPSEGDAFPGTAPTPRQDESSADLDSVRSALGPAEKPAAPEAKPQAIKSTRAKSASAK